MRRDALSWTFRRELGEGLFHHLSVQTQGGAKGVSFKHVLFVLK